MSIDLREIRVQSDAIVLLEFGGLMPSALGGATARIERQGDRYGAQVSTPPMEWEPDGRRWMSRLIRARKEGGIVRLHQLGLDIGSPGAPVVENDTAAGRTIPVEGLTPGYAIREGQALNYIVDGQRYLEFSAEEVIADGSGAAVIPIENLLRVPLSAGDTIDLTDPCLEGWIEGEFSTPRDTTFTTQFSFSISEKA